MHFLRSYYLQRRHKVALTTFKETLIMKKFIASIAVVFALFAGVSAVQAQPQATAYCFDLNQNCWK